jgi:hypothetical protein
MLTVVSRQAGSPTVPECFVSSRVRIVRCLLPSRDGIVLLTSGRPKSCTYPMVERWAGGRIVALTVVLGMFPVVSCGHPANALPSPPTSVTGPSVESFPQGSSPFGLFVLAMAPGVAYAANNQGLTQNGGSSMIVTKSKEGESVVLAARKPMNNLWRAQNPNRRIRSHP